MSSGAGNRFIVDRKTFVPNTTKELPVHIRAASSYKAGTLKGYIARFDDIKNHLIKSNDPKVVIHLLPAYQPLSEDWVTTRHALYMIYEWITTGDVYYLFLVHTPDSQPRRNLPSSIGHYRILPSMPVMLELVYIIPQSSDFVDADRQQLTGITFDFLASISHKPDPLWNAYLGDFASKPIMSEQECEGYIDFTWQDLPESAVIDAECVSTSHRQTAGELILEHFYRLPRLYKLFGAHRVLGSSYPTVSKRTSPKTTTTSTRFFERSSRSTWNAPHPVEIHRLMAWEMSPSKIGVSISLVR